MVDLSRTRTRIAHALLTRKAWQQLAYELADEIEDLEIKLHATQVERDAALFRMHALEDLRDL